MNPFASYSRFLRAAAYSVLFTAILLMCACSLFRSGPETTDAEKAASESVEQAEERKPANEVKPESPVITAPLVIPPAPDYANPSSWVKLGETGSVLPEFEVFYIYPTLFQNKLRPVMDHRFDSIRTKSTRYTDLTFGLLTDPVHPLKLYAPFVRQADYSTALETDFTADLGDMLLRHGIEDTKTAFLYFLERLHTPGMPYILIGHSQGASDLYELLRSTPEITPESGFAAAYLAGLPKKTAAEIDRDFEGRGVHRGKGADDVGAILVWNTVSEDSGESIFTVPGGFVINPLSWKTDGAPADTSGVLHKAYYYVSEKEPAGTFDPVLLNGAYADSGRGALVVGLPGDSQYDASAQMGEGIFHANDIFFFADSIRDNMTLRTAAWRRLYGGRE